MNRQIETEKAPPSFSNYSQGVETPAGARTLHISGQVGVDLDGNLVTDLVGQIETAWQNVFAILEAADMEKTDIIDVLVLLRDHEAVPVFRDVRDRLLANHRACSTMLICGLANPDWRVEIAVKAAK